jgi:hypothetical protein
MLDMMGAPYLIVFAWMGIEQWLNGKRSQEFFSRE